MIPFWPVSFIILTVLNTYSDLEEKARELLALGQFLSNIDNPQVAFGVRQKRPETVDAAVTETIELHGVILKEYHHPYTYCRGYYSSGRIRTTIQSLTAIE